ncbi:hypothetical protein T4B_4995 [Trichinella pseudospiralis]|uniref:Uncharacterized protein n=1 Tax=Trichinella pseudospiralis TaxID=6337 RepID=A0A0V1GM40_TRIPS|nr:hypothetical protein T4B_4995 [Trichinella pseudospiralis]KRZ01136.1 hypothetical protein T4C_8760 [Trichinella pseudospiralis]KRZ01140.1 hypothetical protein T4C_3396 [Trichinella pseudospiralis]KRZ01151.1 hypothetical protein T4C_12741 [Trichinella pseudospiralis]
MRARNNSKSHTEATTCTYRGKPALEAVQGF